MYLAVYIVPANIMFYFGAETLLRNPRRVVNWVLSLDLISFGLMFIEEFVRQLAPVSASPFLVTYGLGNLGAVSTAVGLHFYCYLTGIANRTRPAVYLPLAYLPVVPVVITFALHRNLYNSTDFRRIGLWVQPVYNGPYYIAIWCGIGVIACMAIAVFWAARGATFSQLRRRRFTLFCGTMVMLVWYILAGGLAGKFPIFLQLPPYLYLYGIVVWLLLLRWAMLRHNLLPSFELRYRTLFRLAPAAIMILDDMGQIIEANPRARFLFGHRALKWSDVMELDGHVSVREWLAKHFRARGRIRVEEMRFARADGSTMIGEVHVELVEMDGNGRLMVLVWDTTQRNLVEQEIRRLAYTDTLTELPNRAHFYQLLEQEMASAGETGRRFGLVVMDVDRFKQVNDTYGHLVGDAVIRHVGQVLKQAETENIVAARLSGDEFVMLIQDVASRDDIEATVAAITTNLSGAITVDGHIIPLSVSVGWSLYPDDGETEQALIKVADMAMYHTKHQNRDVVAP